MMNDPLAQFRDLKRQLLDNIDQYDTPEFRAIDEKASAAFERIMTLSPRSPDDAKTLIHFLLDMVACDPDGASDRMIARIRELTAALAGWAHGIGGCGA